ncbi:hypothetical protein D0B54_06305 [Solimonas sp. K1W22B-7]|uniref:hypothetical protein n=1 Tax=Solimonas sp. K1W22B-7 TaxID=2303331 RepID=UPI000E32D902|nr:hypothetical protein [Solimonas sp. K1W22B-7]AXQ28318.1 hypothetical protein D0B54_06305 [Solimonas sp. K1W22B-7]
MIPHFAFSDYPQRVRRLPRLPSAARNGAPLGRSPARVRPQVVETADAGEYLPAYLSLIGRHFGRP